MEGQKNFGKRGTPMAWACVVLGCGATLGGMWMLSRDVKKHEMKHLPYEHSGQGINGTDKAMTSGDVAKVASGVPTPYSERLPGAVPRSPAEQVQTEKGKSELKGNWL